MSTQLMKGTRGGASSSLIAMIAAHEQFGGGGRYLLSLLVYHVAHQEALKACPKHGRQGCALCATQALLEPVSLHCVSMYAGIPTGALWGSTEKPPLPDVAWERNHLVYNRRSIESLLPPCCNQDRQPDISALSRLVY